MKIQLLTDNTTWFVFLDIFQVKKMYSMHANFHTKQNTFTFLLTSLRAGRREGKWHFQEILLLLYVGWLCRWRDGKFWRKRDATNHTRTKKKPMSQSTWMHSYSRVKKWWKSVIKLLETSIYFFNLNPLFMSFL